MILKKKKEKKRLNVYLTTNPTLVNRVVTLPPLTTVMDQSIVFVDVDNRPAVQPKPATLVYNYTKFSSNHNLAIPYFPIFNGVKPPIQKWGAFMVDM